MWKTFVGVDWPQTAIWCMLDTQNYKYKLIICNIITFPLQKCLHEPSSMSRYTYSASLVLLIEDSRAVNIST